jgi:hypothetical protein
MPVGEGERMISMRRTTRVWGTAAVVLLVASTALAAKKDKKKAPPEPEHKGGLMEEGGKDPAETETLEEGAFAPGKTYVPEDEREGAVDEYGEPIPQTAKPKKKKRGEPEEEPKKEEPRRPPRKTIGVFGEALIGFGKVPLPGPGNQEGGSGTSFGFLVGGHYDLSTSFRLLLRVPWTTISVDGTSSAAFGNPELGGRLRLTEPGAPTEWSVKVGVGIPIAQGQPDPTASGTEASAKNQAYAQRLADGANGWHDPELYAMDRLPISASLLFSHRSGGLRLGADLKAVLLPAIGGGPIASPTPPVGGGSYEKNNFALDTVLGGTAAYEVIQRGYIALAAWAVYRVIEPIEYNSSATSETRFQFVLEPKILAQFGPVVPSIGFVLPLGGQLGGNVTGLRLHVDVVF